MKNVVCCDCAFHLLMNSARISNDTNLISDSAPSAFILGQGQGLCVTYTETPPKDMENCKLPVTMLSMKLLTR